jgi:hypothetical protein
MPSSRAFAYNPSGLTGGNWSNFGSISVGNTSSFGGVGSSLKWWNGPDEDLGYVVAQPVTSLNQPSPDGSTAGVGFWRSQSKSDASFIELVNRLPQRAGQTLFSTGASASSWLNSNGFWSSWTATVSGVSFIGGFVNSTAPTTTVETAWNTFRASLTGSYTSFTWSSSNGNTLTVTHPTLVQTLADGLRTATITAVTINSVAWRVGTGCGTPKIGGVAVEFSNIASCSASSTYALRPMINNQNWGGTNESTVSAPSQTITLTFS